MSGKSWIEAVKFKYNWFFEYLDIEIYVEYVEFEYHKQFEVCYNKQEKTKKPTKDIFS